MSSTSGVEEEADGEAYEREREERIKRNKAMMAALEVGTRWVACLRRAELQVQ